MRTTLALAILALTVSAGAASAAPYGTAGCGLGSMAFGDKPGIIQIFAATTNGFFGTQTFGITSGTSNCGEATVAVSKAKQFIQTNREALAKDISRGGGETVANLSTLGGCRDAGAVGGALQRSFKTIFPSATVSDVAVSDSVVSVLRGDSSLACVKLQ